MVVSGTWPGQTTGYATAVTSSLREYLRFFEQVHLFGPAAERFPDRLEWKTDRLVLHPIPWLNAPQWRRFLSSLASRWPAITRRFKAANAAFLTELARTVRNCDVPPVLIYEDLPCAVFLPAVRKRHPGVRQIVRSHNVSANAFDGLRRWGTPLSRAAWALEHARIVRFESELLATADQFWAITRDDADAYFTRSGKSCDGVFGVSLDADHYSDVPAGDGRTIVHIGSADLRKGLGLRRFLEDVWPLVRRRVPDARFVVGGRGTETLTSLGGKVTGLGFVADDRDLLSQGQVFVNPQSIGSGIKLKSVVAMLAGKALVSTPIGIEGVIGTPGRHFVVGESAEQLAGSIVRLLTSEGVAGTLGKQARELAAREYSQAALTRSVTALLRPLADRGRSAA